MAKVKVVGEAVVVVSAMKLEDLKTIAKYRPEALTLKGGEDNKEPIFRVYVGGDSEGGLNAYGAQFGSETHDDEKLATITMGLGDIDERSVEDYIADELGSAIMNLNALEATLPEVLESIKADKATVLESISVVL